VRDRQRRYTTHLNAIVAVDLRARRAAGCSQDQAHRCLSLPDLIISFFQCLRNNSDKPMGKRSACVTASVEFVDYQTGKLTAGYKFAKHRHRFGET
jgi:hypothetical protein